jgi:hypothetical protein
VDEAISGPVQVLKTYRSPDPFISPVWLGKVHTSFR